MGHDVLAIEQYTAEVIRPLERCLQDVRTSDVYVVIAAWRYGFVPADASNKKAKRSITELEYQEALESRVAILAFLLDPQAPCRRAPWTRSERAARRTSTRSAGGSARTISPRVHHPDNLARQVAASIAAKASAQPHAPGARQVERAARMTPFAKAIPTRWTARSRRSSR